MMQDQDLDRLLARAAQAPPPASPALLDRVLNDALAEQSRRLEKARKAGRKPQRQRLGVAGGLDWLAEAFGGGPMLAGVLAAACAGLAIGFLEPGTLDLLVGGGGDLADLFSEIDFPMMEG